ncbi:Tfp pilus assembly protein PilF [Inhella inkyongensis]|uniref:Tfp pilus assembly protein PilF n=1 Tax=Inhella inkyongensis TaxID=392593 RepID=A0A840S906_9BURK|nr:tetratricopeptide repeat protein [Inhella inkyongensis]MBB5206123.1 Tfp pilus assembly protein PilF [Inhella inkyongensis]
MRLEYDASTTRTAAEAFDARAGNCLSLVLLTAALAYHIGLSVRFQSVRIEDVWSRSRNFMLLSGHVNVTLAHERYGSGRSLSTTGFLTIDFIPLDEESRLQAISLSEETVVAMFMNNRAVELMEQGQLANAHAMVKQALAADPRYFNALNTLAVLYRRHGDLPRAERSLRTLLQHEPRNVSALSNLVLLLRQLGRTEEARVAEAALQQVQPRTPFLEFERGLAAARTGDWAAAQLAFERELVLTPQFDELHFWLGQTYYQLGQRERAARHMALAREHALTPEQRRRYAYKLEVLRRPQPTATPH